MTPSLFLFALILTLSTLITLSSTNWLYLWVGMELNLLSFIPLMASSTNLQETEASVKYFIIQAIGSGVMLTAGIISTNPITLNFMELTMAIMFISSMTMKLGMAPYHQWLPHVMSSIPWIMCLILSTWQKIGPLSLLVYLTPSHINPIVISICIINAMVGSIGGINQSQLRSLLAYSSMGHMAWMLATVNCSINMFILYFSTYIMVSTTLMTLMIMNNNILSNSSSSLFMMNSMMFLMIMLTMFSMGGLPPFLGFLPKWLIIFNLINVNMINLAIMLISGSLINLFYYFNMTFNFILSKYHMPKKATPPLILMFIVTVTTLAPIALYL